MKKHIHTITTIHPTTTLVKFVYTSPKSILMDLIEWFVDEGGSVQTGREYEGTTGRYLGSILMREEASPEETNELPRILEDYFDAKIHKLEVTHATPKYIQEYQEQTEHITTYTIHT